jgi:hypothetical protein
MAGYTAVTDFLRDVRPSVDPRFEVRFETPPGEEGQVDFAQCRVVFVDEPSMPTRGGSDCISDTVIATHRLSF